MTAVRAVVVAPHWRSARWATSAAFGAQGLLFAVLLTHLPQFKDRWGIGDTTVSLLVLVVSLLAGAGSVGAETLARRASSAVALRIGLATIVVASVAVALAPDLPVFVAGFALYGLGLGAVDAGSNMQAVAVQHGYGRSILTSFHAVWSAAGILGALWVALSERIDLPLSASVLAGSVAVAVLAVVSGRSLASGRSLHDATVPGDAPLTVPWRPVLLLGAAMACFYVADGATSNWSAIYLHDTLGATDTVAAFAYAAYQATSVLARLGGDHVVRRAGIVATVRLAAVVGTLGLLVVVVAPGPLVAIVGFGVVGVALPVVAPLCFSAAGALAPGGADAVVARVNVFNYLGAVVGGVSVGLIGAGSLRVGFVLPLVLAAVLLGLARAFATRPVGVDRGDVVT
ncbi:MFS transporter [Jatrophihabitans sp. YIM 134969]